MSVHLFVRFDVALTVVIFFIQLMHVVLHIQASTVMETSPSASWS